MEARDKVNILLVDDQIAKLLSYEAILGELGENLVKVSSGREALDVLLKTDIAVVLMDVSMPELDGFELANLIRQHPRFEQTAIIFISAIHLTDIDRIQGYKHGAVDYISVPIIPELLRAKVSVFAELHRKTRQMERLNRDLNRLSSRLIAAQDEERRRIARELHDGLGQELSAAKMIVDGILASDMPSAVGQNAAQECSSLLNRAIQQVRSMSHLLHPPLLDQIGLRSALEQYLRGFTERSNIEASIDLPRCDFPRLKPELETAIFRVVQEALTNVFRHARAQRTWVTLSTSDDRILVSIRDDGKGLSEEVLDFRPGSIGVGLGGMRQRVEEFGGEVRLQSLNPGAQVEVAIPLNAMTMAPTAKVLTP
jgi:signal transduction histidine kinase